MRYSVTQSLADFGFNFFEKLNEPIFLVSKMGQLTRANEAGRKLLSVAHLNAEEIEKFFSAKILSLLKTKNLPQVRLETSADFHLIARNLKDCDYILVEVRR
jgi:hypothetical protein